MKVIILAACLFFVSCSKDAREQEPKIESLTVECAALRDTVASLETKMGHVTDLQAARISHLEELTDWQKRELQAVVNCLARSPQMEILTIEEMRAHGNEKGADAFEKAMWNSKGISQEMQDTIRKARSENSGRKDTGIRPSAADVEAVEKEDPKRAP
jgi:hypothetical protein